MNRIFIYIVLFIAVFSIANGSGDWTYPITKPNGVLDDSENWGGMCKNGTRQSPVDLAHKAAVTGHFSKFVFHNYDEVLKNPKIINNGHSIQINSESRKYKVSGGGLNGTYVFEQMHFHWPSEHTIDNKRMGLELHIVHYNDKFNSTAYASQDKEGIAVLGILFHVDEDDNPIIDELLKNSGNVSENAGKTMIYEDEIKLEDYIPKHTSSYFRYDGSLTTPSCGEAVVWSVFEETIPISMQQVEKFMHVKDSDGHELTHNYRSVQPLNARALVYISETEDSSAVLSCLTFTTLITSLMAHFFIKL